MSVRSQFLFHFYSYFIEIISLERQSDKQLLDQMDINLCPPVEVLVEQMDINSCPPDKHLLDQTDIHLCPSDKLLLVKMDINLRPPAEL